MDEKSFRDYYEFLVEYTDLADLQSAKLLSFILLFLENAPPDWSDDKQGEKVKHST